MTRLAIMQPYFFPYIGYWQLMHAVDRFVIYDDVNYINRGWVNRNRLLINGTPTYVTVPLQRASQNRRICDTRLESSTPWRAKLTRAIANTYRRAPHFDTVFPVVEQIIRHDSDDLGHYLAHQLQTLAAFMDLDTEFVVTSRRYENERLAGPERILDICKREGASTYINAAGGASLYEQKAFRSAGVALRFLVMQPLPYPQRAAGFVPSLSIIDALMELGPLEIRRYLAAYDLVPASQTGESDECPQ